jgi:FlaA1/EpsC-like NDP-sugar epimerase
MNIPFKANLKDKVVVITGGAGVLGSDFARAIAQCDAKVAILDLSEEKAKELAEELNKKG